MICKRPFKKIRKNERLNIVKSIATGKILPFNAGTNFKAKVQGVTLAAQS